MTVSTITTHITCPECGSGIHIHPKVSAEAAQCSVCQHVVELNCSTDLEGGQVKQCPVCGRHDFYSQKDFNRKIGVLLFIVAAIASIYTYGLSLVFLYLIDLFLFRKLKPIVVCYKCQTIFRNAKNAHEIPGFDHEMNDRIIYADHDFKGKPLNH